MARILIICPKDGTFLFRKELIFRLKELKYEVFLAGPYGKKIDLFTTQGIGFINVNIDRRGKNAVKDFRLFLDYLKVMKIYKPDLILTYTTKCSVYGGLAARILKIPYIVNNAGLIDTGKKKDFISIVLRCLYRIGFKNAACMMYQNTYERDTINHLFKKPPRYRDIPGSGVNLDQYRFINYPQSETELYFNTIGRVMESKGIIDLISCARIIKKKYSNTHFRIYGDFADNVFPTIINKAELEGIIEYKGPVADVKPEIISAHAVIHPSHYEGMANVILEHGAMGRPCIGSDVPGVKEAIEDGITGYVFQVKNIESMSDAVEKFIKLSLSDKREMGKASRKKMENEFNREIVTNIYVEEIRRILGF